MISARMGFVYRGNERGRDCASRAKPTKAREGGKEETR
jgi:hypothetical protein